MPARDAAIVPRQADSGKGESMSGMVRGAHQLLRVPVEGRNRRWENSRHHSAFFNLRRPPPILFPVTKFGVRRATAFVDHSSLPEGEELIGELTEFVSKLGVDCDSGKKAEAVGISEKVRCRIKESEFFIGTFTTGGSRRGMGARPPVPPGR